MYMYIFVKVISYICKICFFLICVIFHAESKYELNLSQIDSQYQVNLTQIFSNNSESRVKF